MGSDPLARSPLHLLHRVGQFADELFAAEIGSDLTPRQLIVLLTVAENEGLNQTGIVDRTGIDRSTLADIVRRLKAKGLLERRRTKQDARAYAVKLTGEGRRLVRVATPVAKRVDDRILAALGARGGAFLGGLQQIMAAASSRKQR